MAIQHEVAKGMLEAGAVELRPKDLFTWASGIKSPIYCDTRLTISFPKVRTVIAKGLANLIQEKFPSCEVVAGTATAGIPHAAWVADILQQPMVYVRSKPKDHGRGKQTEGVFQQGAKVVVIEDIVSTGGSSINAVEALQREGAEVLGVVSVYSYLLPAAIENFEKAGVPYFSLSNFEALVEAAEETGAIHNEDIPGLLKWYEDLKAGNLK
ncbi:MAG: orotate phosphoribosyltransferase [Kurthia sp.]|nr:orotate phosphoribosyltransferase [Candidatus Kurthia equi]